MSTCSSCGEEIKWAQRGDGRAHPPLVYLGQTLIVDTTNVVRTTASYKVHHCDPDDIERWTKFRAETRQQADEYRASRDEFNTLAMRRACQRCGADVGEMCWNLRERDKGNHVHTKWCHTERGPDGGTVDGDEVQP